jgi:hypothetical protein
MHRSGTSALTALLDGMGFSAGGEFHPHDAFNPRGLWEDRELHAVDEEVLAECGRVWWDPLDLDLGALSGPSRDRYLGRFREVVARLERQESWVIKDPRLCLLLPLWREALQRPLCVLVHRHPAAVARSLAARDGIPLAAGVALWEAYTRAALDASRGLPRLLLACEELFADPAAVSARLKISFELLGLAAREGGEALEPAAAAALVDRSLDHHGGSADADDVPIAEEQRALHAARLSGSALQREPPALCTAGRAALLVLRELGAHASNLERLRDEALDREGELAILLAERDRAVETLESKLLAVDRALVERAGEIAACEGEIAARDALLAAVFASRSWRLGHRITGWWRRLRGGRAIDAVERWRTLRARR